MVLNSQSASESHDRIIKYRWLGLTPKISDWADSGVLSQESNKFPSDADVAGSRNTLQNHWSKASLLAYGTVNLC